MENEQEIQFHTDIKNDLRLINKLTGYSVSYSSPPLSDLGYNDFSYRIEEIEIESKNKIDLLIDELFDKFTTKS